MECEVRWEERRLDGRDMSFPSRSLCKRHDYLAQLQVWYIDTYPLLRLASGSQ